MFAFSRNPPLALLAAAGRKTMERFALFCLAAALPSGLALPEATELSRYFGRDLRKLTTNEMASFRAEFRARTGIEPGEKLGTYPLDPWLVSAYQTPLAAWVLVEAYPGYEVPDVSGVKLYFFDKSWKSICIHTFPTGYRAFLTDVTIQKQSDFHLPLIVAKTISTGPFMRTARDPFPPPLGQRGFFLKYYALSETNLFLVRSEKNDGSLVRNGYGGRSPMTGLAVPARTKEDWIASLNSSDVVEQLATLVWLTGCHLSSKEPRMPDHFQESIEDSRLFESVRDEPRTSSLLEALKQHSNRWIQDYAGLGIAKLDQE